MKRFSSCLWTQTLSVSEILPLRFLQGFSETVPQGAQLSWGLVIPVCGGATCWLCPSEPQAANTKLWQQHPELPVPVNFQKVLPLSGIYSGWTIHFWNPKAPAGLRCSHTSDCPLGFGNLSLEVPFRDSYSPKTARKHTIAFSTTVTLNELLKKTFFWVSFLRIYNNLKNTGTSAGWEWLYKKLCN